MNTVLPDEVLLPGAKTSSLFLFLFFLLRQIEREVTEAMMKSLKYCDLQTESARQPLYQYRAATIHHRLASMYHSCFRNQVGYNSVCPGKIATLSSFCTEFPF